MNLLKILLFPLRFIWRLLVYVIWTRPRLMQRNGVNDMAGFLNFFNAEMAYLNHLLAYGTGFALGKLLRLITWPLRRLLRRNYSVKSQANDPKRNVTK